MSCAARVDIAKLRRVVVGKRAEGRKVGARRREEEGGRERVEK